ncbi:MAG: DUF1800 domain-containing protein [Armatimonadaceae bacterium]
MAITVAALGMTGALTAFSVIVGTATAGTPQQASSQKSKSKLAEKSAKAPTTNKSAKTTKAPTSDRMNPVGDRTPLTEEQKVIHALNRMGFGPRPGDVEKVKQIGLNNYINQQLYPEKINDSALEGKLSSLSLLKLSNQELAGLYMARQKKTPKLLAAREKMENSKEKDQNPRAAIGSLNNEERDALRAYMEAQQKIRTLGLQMVMDKTARAVESEKQFQEVMVDFWSNHFNIDMRKNFCQVYKPADERDVIRKHSFGKFRDLLEASAKSPAMLVYLDNFQSSAPREANPAQERRRKQMLERAAKNGNEEAQYALMAMQNVGNRGRGGLNENYAREIMELHTLGVDGGYTQKDVQEVARCLTGWTVNNRTGEFVFTPLRHDRDAKVVLGNKIPAGGGIEDGMKVLDILSNHPSTMRFVSTKLCQRLVSDEPPASLVDKCVATWKRTGGDLREIYRTILTSPEFYSREAYRQKIKSPFEYAVSSVRALGGSVRLPAESDMAFRFYGAGQKGQGFGPKVENILAGQVSVMGQALYQYQAPTGYPEDSRKWVSSGALISRLNFSLALAGQRISDVNLANAKGLVAGVSEPKELVNRLGDSLLHGEMTPSTRATLLKQVGATPENPDAAATDTPARLVALVLGSPEFQRR